MITSQAKSAAILEEKHRKALVNLLADEDAKVYRTVRETILSYGPASSDWMREHTLSNDPILRRRAREIVDQFARQDSDTHFLAFCLNQGEDFDLEQGVLLLCRTQYPDINLEAYSALLDSYAGDLRQRLDLNGLPEHIIRVINDYLYRELKFAGDEQNFYDPKNSYFNRVLDRRIGNPITLSLLYLLLARRLRLPMAGIGLPGHFLCRFQSSRAEMYIDPFKGGRMLVKADCVKMVMQLQHRFDDSFLAPFSARRILQRICSGLHQVYIQQKSTHQAERLQRYLVALAK
ncbi:MAG TPA: transglutaminase-like domain-containing protein [Candidatus Cybelea sp.]|jgi:regulator of sirC expression with transglutaminase-like and TPR domain|nr:transglutaminase-like domain-containing protein [Candidatus Cybelea sp.]